MDHLTPQIVLEIALRIQICDKKSLDIDFSPENIRIHLPPQRSLAFHCAVSEGNLLGVLYKMENQHLIKKEERIGIYTTPLGNQEIADLIEKKFRKEARALFGQKILQYLVNRIRTSVPNDIIKNPDHKDDERPSLEQEKKQNSGDGNLLNFIYCNCCQKKIYTNDRRRKYCDHCRLLSHLKKIRSRQTLD
jgi:DNA-binding PadR family transcriptional regulator